LARTFAFLIEVFRDFHEYIDYNYDIELLNRSRPLPDIFEFILSREMASADSKRQKKVMQSLQQAVEARRVVRRRGSHIFQTVGSQMAVRLSALHASHPLPPETFLILISVRGCVDLRAIVRLELKNPNTSSGIEPLPSGL
jgi:hypothetical protein